MSDITLDQILTQRLEADNRIVDVDEPVVKLVIFGLGDEWYAFPGQGIREILARADVFFVPGCPPSLEGVINVRGDIESVIRLNELLKIADQSMPVATADSSRKLSSAILLGRGGGMSSGIRVDTVVDVVDLPQSAIQPPPATLPEHLRHLVSGVLRFNERPVVVLDLDRLFSDYARGLG